MKKHLPSATVLFALLLVLCLHAFAADNPSDSGRYTPTASGSGYLFTAAQTSTRAKLLPTVGAAETLEALRTTPDITVNGTSIGYMTPRCTVDGTVYVAVSPILQTLFPDTSITFQDGCLTAAGDPLCLQAREGDAYFQVNQRYFYVPSLVQVQEDRLLLPARTLAEAVGCSLQGDGEEDLVFRQVSPVRQGTTYNADDLYWLSRAIFAEAGNQSMQGRIAVGTVILNRVANPQFPNTVEEVLFEPGQFSPVSNGTIYREPDEDSLVAAKLCLDGVREAGDSLYFNVTSLYSWADQSRTYYCTIGGHNFYL